LYRLEIFENRDFLITLLHNNPLGKAAANSFAFFTTEPDPWPNRWCK